MARQRDPDRFWRHAVRETDQHPVSFGIPVRNGLGVGLLVSTFLSTRRGMVIPTPALALNFLSGSLDGRITFTRSTTATFVGSNGLIQTAAIDAPRFDYNPGTLAAIGLLIEEARTNLMLQSEDFATTWSPVSATVTTNTTVAPDGATTGDTVTASTTASYVSQAVVFTGDGNKSYSLFVKAGTATVTRLVLRDTTAAINRGGVNLTWTAGVPAGVATEGTLQGIDAYPNGWYRVRMLALGVVAANVNQFRFSPDTAVGTNNTIFWGAQTENGAFATSYIPTTTAAVPRSADLAVLTGTNFSTWYNASEGTFVSAYDQLSATAAQIKTIAVASDGTVDNQIYGYVSATGQPTSLVTTATVAQATIVNAIIGSNVTAKTAFAYKVNDFAIATNGGTVATDTLGTVPTGLTSLGVGALSAGGSQLNGHIRTLTFYNTRLTDPQMQMLTV